MAIPLSHVYVDASQFVAAHGKQPRGTGSWAFAVDKKAYGDDVVFFPGTYQQARHKAKQHFAAIGEDYIYALS